MSHRHSQDAQGWSFTRRIFQVLTALLTIAAFVEGFRRPDYLFAEINDDPALLMRLATAIFAAFLPSMLFGLTFVRSWK